jgi:tetratricopeptide (TPR) repeat protein
VTRSEGTESGLGWRHAAAIFALGLAARLVYVAVGQSLELFPGLFLDSAFYARVAAEIRSGAGVSEHPYLLSPLYPYFLALFASVDEPPAANSLLVVRYVQAFVGAGTCVAAALLAARIHGRAAGIIAGGTCALFGPLIHYDAAVLVASLQAFFLTLAIALASAEKRPGFVIGVCLGIAAALRPSALLIALALGVFWILELRGRERQRTLGALAAGVMLVVLPFTIRNRVVAGETVLLSTNGGWNFWIGNHDGASGLHERPPGSGPALDTGGGTALGLDLARAELGESAGYAAASDWWRDRALRDITDAPLDWGRRLGFKALLYLHPDEIPQLGWSYGWFAARAWPLRLPLDARWLFLFALLAPFVVRSARLRPALVAVLAHAAGVCLFFVAGRYRAPILPIVIALAAVGAVGWFELWRSGKRRAAGTAIALLLATAFASWHVYDADGPLALRGATGIEERHRAMAQLESGQLDAALASLSESLAILDSPVTRAQLARTLHAAGRTIEAVREYETVLLARPDDAFALVELGTIRWDFEKRGPAAEALFERATRARPGLADAHFNLGVVRLAMGRPEEALEPLKQALSLAGPETPWHADALRAWSIAVGSTGTSP